jgi:hypothetical protein
MDAGTEPQGQSRHWRSALTVFGWLLLLQAAVGLVFGVPSLMFRNILGPGDLARDIGGSGQLVPGYEALPGLLGMLEVALWAGLGFNLALLVGAIGLLKRQKWGWYTTVVVHVLVAGGLFIFLPNAFESILAAAAPATSPLVPWLLALLAILPALTVVAFLLLGPVVRQFERPAEPAA